MGHEDESPDFDEPSSDDNAPLEQDDIAEAFESALPQDDSESLAAEPLEADEVFQQDDIAEPFESAIPDDDSELLPVEPLEADEVFQQDDIAEPFESAIPEAILETPKTPAAHVSHISQEVFQQKDIAEPFDLAVEPTRDKHLSRATEPLLFDDDYSAHPTPAAPESFTPASETSFHAEEFGPTIAVESPAPTPQEGPQHSFEDLTLAEMVGLFWRRPFATWGALLEVLTDSSDDSKKKDALVSEALTSPQGGVSRPRFNSTRPDLAPLGLNRERRRMFQPGTEPLDRITLGLHVIAYVLALWGCLYFVSNALERRQESLQLVGGLPFLVMGFSFWIVAELIQHRQGIRAWIRSRHPINWVLMVLRLIPLLLWGWVLLRWMDASDESLDQSLHVLDMIAPTFSIVLVGIVIWVGIDLISWGLRSLFPASLRPPDFTEIPALPAAPDVSASEEASDEGTLKKRKIAGLRIPRLEDIDRFKAAATICGAILTVITYLGSANNRMSDPIFYTWIASVVLWAIALAPGSWHPREWAQQWRTRLTPQSLPRPSVWTVLAVLGIVFLGVWMRIDRLYGDPSQGTRIPPEMTSDHVEKILDAQRILEGPESNECYALPNCNRDIFFANNGGREPFQMYALAFIANLTGRDVDYNLLKTLALFESLLTLPIMGWLAWEILVTEKRGLRLTFAFMAMGLLAVSYWHLNITRLSLRIVLTPAITALLLIYLARGMRGNNRADFIKAGICLGIGLYMYQAVRMLPVVIVLGVGIAAYFGTAYWRERGRYALNLATLILISFVIFVPMFRYSVENPDMFLRRTAGRLFGDDIISTKLTDGTIIERRATVEEQITAFRQNIPALLSNVRNSLLMFHWKGDVAWINNAPNWPALDPFVGALLILGVAAWGSLAVRRGDVVYAFLPVVILVMLLPSALSIAYPIENPSFTRTSGALPAVFLLAAYPLALFIEQLNLLIYGQNMRRALRLVAAFMLVGAYSYSMSLYTTEFFSGYKSSSLPYSDVGRILNGFAVSDGSYGNAFMIAYIYWWDHRAIGLEAGLTDWPNGIVSRENVPRFLSDAALRSNIRYRLDPQKDLLFFYAVPDLETSAALKAWFPQGHERQVVTYQEGDDFMQYRVPALGDEGFAEFVQQAVDP